MTTRDVIAGVRGRRGAWGALVLVGVLGCSSPGMPRPVAPREERAVLDLAPHDAYMAARLDLRVARATPHWAELGALLMSSGLKEVGPYLEGTDRVWVVLGSLMEAPTYDETPSAYGAPQYDEDDEDAYVDEGYPIAPDEVYADEEAPGPGQPAWVPVARAFDGHLPRAVVVIEGSSAVHCETLVDGQALRQVRGYQLGVANGLAVLVREGRCVLTLEPVLDSLLQQPAGAAPDVIGMLGGASDAGDGSLLSYAIDYRAPAYAADIATRVAHLEATVEAERALLREREDANAFGGGAGPFAQRMALIHAMTRNVALWSAQAGLFGLNASRVTTRGLLGSTARLAHTADGYAFHARWAFDDGDRATMWRELGAMYSEVLRIGVASFDIPDPYKAALLAWFDGLRFEEHRDGFSYHARTSDEHVSQVLRAVDAALTPDVEVERERGPVPDQLLRQLQLIRSLEDSNFAPPRQVITELEPLVDELVSDDMFTTSEGVANLARAFSSVGRHDDAIALLRRGVDRWRELLGTSAPGLTDDPEQFQGMCWLVSVACEEELTWGFAESAQQFTQEPVGPDTTCADLHEPAFYCQQRAASTRGDHAGALQRVVDRPSHSLGSYLWTRAELMMDAGRYDDAFEVIRDACAGPFDGVTCRGVRPRLARFVSHHGSTLGEWDALMAAMRAASPGEQSVSTYDDDEASVLAIADCARRVRLAPRAVETRDACTAARDVTDRLHGPTHAHSLAARVYLAQALAAAGPSPELTALESDLTASRALVGPQHVLHQRSVARPRAGRRGRGAR